MGLAARTQLADKSRFLSPAGVVDTGAASPIAGWDSARAVNLSVTGISEDLTSTISLLNMTGSTGCVLHFGGGGGASQWDFGAAADAYFAGLVADGYRIVDNAYGTQWEDGPAGVKLGYHRMAARCAGTIKYVHDTYSGGLPFIVVGSSGGSSQIAFALTFYGLADIIDTAILTDGPPHADIFKGCNRLPGEEAYWYDTDSANRPDAAMGYPADGTGPCFIGDESVDGPMWVEASILSGKSFDWPTTDVKFLLGENDITQAKPQADLLIDRLWNQGRTYPRIIMLGGGHGAARSAGGISYVGHAVRKNPQVIQQKATTTAPATTVSVTLDHAPAAGKLLVACHAATGASVSITSPGDFTDAITPVTNGTDLAVRVMYKIASGTESVVTFTSPTSLRHSLDVFEIDMDNAVVDQSDPSTASAVTTLANGPTGTTTAAKEWSVCVIGTTTTVTWGNTWTNGFVQLRAATRSTVAAKILTATGAVSTTETWTGSSNAASALVTFKSA